MNPSGLVSFPGQYLQNEERSNGFGYLHNVIRDPVGNNGIYHPSIKAPFKFLTRVDALAKLAFEALPQKTRGALGLFYLQSAFEPLLQASDVDELHGARTFAGCHEGVIGFGVVPEADSTEKL